MPASLILAHDLGTTGNKASLFDDQGKVLASSFYGYGTQHPRPNWVEQNPEDWWRGVCVSTRQLLDTARVRPEEIACVTFSGQMMGCVAVDREARPLRSAIIWADTRGKAEERLLLEALGMEAVYRITGHRASASYSAAKILWIRNNQPELFGGTCKFLHAKDFIVARLTGRFVTDHSDASGMNLLDMQARSWSETILEAVRLDPSLLPEVHASSEVVGEVLPQVAEECGLAAGTPVVIGAGDGVCAAAGAGVVREEAAFTYIGSSAWIALCTRTPVYDPTFRTFNWIHLVPGLYTPNGTMQAAGGAYQWLRDAFCLAENEAAARLGLSPYQLMDLLAEQAPAGAKGLLFLPYLLGERSPWWNPKARGAFLGLEVSHTRADILRATLEGITLNLRIILEALQSQGERVETMRFIGGGARGRIWRQIMADIYGIPVQRPALLAEATSLGAALAGGVGVGLYKDFSLAEELTPVTEVAYPNPSLQPLYDRLYQLFIRAYQALAPLYEELAVISPQELQNG